MTNEAFYRFMEVLSRFFCEVSLSNSPKAEEILRNLADAYLMLLSGMDEEIYTTLKAFFLKNCPGSELNKETTDLLLDYIRYGQGDFEN